MPLSPVRRANPLLYLVPLAVGFAPFLWYSGQAFGWAGGFLSTRVALVACIAAFIAHRIAWGDFSWQPVPGVAIVAPYAGLVLVSVVWSAFGVGSTEIAQLASELVTWTLPLALFVLIAISPLRDGDFAVVGRALLVIMLGAGVVSLSQVLLFAGMGSLVPAALVQLGRHVADATWFGAFRVYGTFPTIGPNMFGVFLVIPAAVLLSRAGGASGSARWVWATGGAAAVAMIAGTLSRGSQLGLIVALLALPLWRRSWRGVIAVGAVGVVGLALILGTAVWSNALKLLAGGQLDTSALERVHIWRAIVREAPAHPFGFGFNGWPRVSGALIDAGVAEGANTVGSRYPAENQWLRELADRGIPGVLALALVIGGLLVITYRYTRTAPPGWPRDFMAGAGAGFAGFAVAMLTGDHLMYENVAGLFWFFAALALSTAARTRSREGLGTARESTATVGPRG